MGWLTTWQAIITLVGTLFGGVYAWWRGVQRDRRDDKVSRGDALSQLDDQVEELFRERISMRRENAGVRDIAEDAKREALRASARAESAENDAAAVWKWIDSGCPTPPGPGKRPTYVPKHYPSPIQSPTNPTTTTEAPNV